MMLEPLGPPRRILFIGDSLTFVNDLDQHVVALARAADPVDGTAISVNRSVRGGSPLKALWKKTDARDQIQNGKYDAVVLQEDLPETTLEDFQKYGSHFGQLARSVGSRLILLATWPYDRLGWIKTDGIMSAHLELAQKIGAEVAPAALAWDRMSGIYPDVDLYADDGEHPTVLGTHLAATVVFATLWKRNPIGLRSSQLKFGGKDFARVCQEVAWDVVENQLACPPSVLHNPDQSDCSSCAERGKRPDRRNLLRTLFERLDQNCDGRLDYSEFVRFADHMGWSSSPKEFVEMCRSRGVGTDEGLSLDGFALLLSGGHHNRGSLPDCADDQLRDFLAEFPGRSSVRSDGVLAFDSDILSRTA